MSGPHIDHCGTKDIVCPWCGYDHRDSWEISQNEDGAQGTMECQQCEKRFEWHCDVSVSYETNKVKDL